VEGGGEYVRSFYTFPFSRSFRVIDVAREFDPVINNEDNNRCLNIRFYQCRSIRDLIYFSYLCNSKEFKKNYKEIKNKLNGD